MTFDIFNEDVFTTTNITHILNDITHILNNTFFKHLNEGCYDGIYWILYMAGFFAPFMFMCATMMLVTRDQNRELVDLHTRLSTTTDKSDANKTYSHKFEHIIRFMNMFDYSGVDETYYDMFHRTQVVTDLIPDEKKNQVGYDFATLIKLIKVDKIDLFEDVIHSLMEAHSLEVKDDMAMFYCCIYFERIEDEFQDFRDIINKLDLPSQQE